MTAYKEMTPEERFEALDEMAIRLFGTKRWKTEFCRTYDLGIQTLQNWRINGAPLWPCVALRDALDAKNWNAVQQMVKKTMP